MKIDLQCLENSATFKRELFLERASQRGFSFLDSNRSDSCTSYLFLDPVACCWATESRSYLQTTDELREFEGVWAAFEEWLEPLLEQLSLLTEDSIPLSCGYFGYEMLHDLESVEEASTNDIQIPRAVFYLYRCVYEIPEDLDLPIKRWEVSGGRFEKLLSAPKGSEKEQSPIQLSADLAGYSNFTQEQYCERVSQIVRLIEEGEVYQVNFTQQFTIPVSIHALGLYQELSRISSSDYAAYLGDFAPQAGDYFSILSSSPERFFRCENGAVECAPIKGTRPRGSHPEEDLMYMKELLESDKDTAELAMIVDLIRNDLGKVCEPGTIHVESHAQLHSFAQVHHLISEVSGSIKSDVSMIELIKALFPCGSITGCPKIAAMKYISELEGTIRGVYTGSIGWLGLNRSAEFNVAIRTAVVLPEKIVFQAGGGVVVDSTPAAEYQESLVKASGIFEALKIFADITHD